MLHIALFVDFDNVYLTLQEYDRDAATAFAADPGRWLAWLEQQIPRMHPTFQGRHCRLLVRRCYLNPSSFWEKRPFFIRSGFEVVDCPPLTNRGKTAADIQIVMDVLDTLQAPTHYDVFVILSADADFTPVLLRLRQHGRFTAMLAVGMVSPAYRAASDLVITQDDFVRHGLGINPPDDDPVYAIPSSVTDQLLLDRMAARLADAATPPEGIVAHELATIYKEFPEFRQSQNWLGFFTLQQLTRALIDRRDDLAFVDEDPWRVVRAESFPETGEARALPELAPASAGGPPQAELLTALSEWVVTTVRSAAYPVPIAVLEVQLNQRHPLATKHWLGHHTCESLLLHLDLDGLQFSSVAPGYLYDPEQHTPPREDGTAPPPRHGRSDAFAGTDDALARFARQINKLTDLPYLQPAHYAVLLTALGRR